MRPTRHTLTGILGALLALMVQIAVGATVPQTDPVASVFSAETLCHADQPSDGSDHKAPPLACLVCPFCVVVHPRRWRCRPCRSCVHPARSGCGWCCRI